MTQNAYLIKVHIFLICLIFNGQVKVACDCNCDFATVVIGG